MVSTRAFVVFMLAMFACGLQLVAAPDRNASSDASEARIGVAELLPDGEIHKVLRADERFAMCSVFKFLVVAAVLQRIDHGEEKLNRFISYGKRDVLEWAPVTKKYLPQGEMTLEALCFAAIAYSDNTAANLLLQTLGGPAGVTAFARRLGDHVTRLDRSEPELNNVAPGDPRDTTSPVAMLRDMKKILLGEALSSASREKLESWMVQNTTGETMILAGVPKGWQVGDKTGQNQRANTNDIAIIRKPDGKPLLLVVFVDVPGTLPEYRAEKIAQVTRELIQ